jgi:lysophospholipase L1-like esterase
VPSADIIPGGTKCPIHKAVPMKAPYALTLMAAALAAIVCAAPTQSEPAAQPSRSMSYYEVRRGLFVLSKLQTAPIVMLGDSLIEAGPWSDLTGCLAIANRGIGGDTTKRVRERLDEIMALKPRAVFLMVGVNDVALDVPREATLDNLHDIFGRLADAHAHGFVSYVLPVTARYANKRINVEVPQLNAAIAKLIMDQPNITAIDVRPQLRGADGTLRAEFSYDGIHLTPKGYAVLRDAIAPHVAKYCVP